MARGYIYEVSTSKNLLDGLTAEYFYEEVDALRVDYVSDDIDVNECVKDVLEGLEKCGFKVDYRERSVCFTTEGKLNFFRNRYAKARNMIEQMSLKEFATEVPFMLCMMIRDTYGDIICKEGFGWEPFDDWIRTTADGTTYYFGGVVLMH